MGNVHEVLFRKGRQTILIKNLSRIHPAGKCFFLKKKLQVQWSNTEEITTQKMDGICHCMTDVPPEKRRFCKNILINDNSADLATSREYGEV